MIRVQPIIFTTSLHKWTNLLSALGLSQLSDEPGWKVFAADAGRIALHDGDESRVDLWFDADDAAQLTDELAKAGGSVNEMDLGEGVTVWEAKFDGVVIGVGSPAPNDPVETRDPSGLSVFPLWYTANVERASTVLRKLGVRPRISADGGGWADFIADDGLIAVHHANIEEGALAFEYGGDLDTLQQKLRDAGIDSRRIDETFGATLRVDHPDGQSEIWINEPQNDLYGYHEG